MQSYLGCPGRRLYSPRAERTNVRPPSPPSAQSVQTKARRLGDNVVEQLSMLFRATAYRELGDLDRTKT